MGESRKVHLSPWYNSQTRNVHIPGCQFITWTIWPISDPVGDSHSLGSSFHLKFCCLSYSFVCSMAYWESCWSGVARSYLAVRGGLQDGVWDICMCTKLTHALITSSGMISLHQWKIQNFFGGGDLTFWVGLGEGERSRNQQPDCKSKKQGKRKST